jgi:Anti-sigma-K factor rskA
MEELNLHDLLVQNALGEPLAREDLARLDAALDTDPALRAEAAELTQALVLLAQGVQATPPARLRERVLASVKAQTAPGISRQSRWPYALAAVVTGLAIAMATMLSLENQRLRSHLIQQTAAAPTAQSSDVVSFAMRGTGTAQRAEGLVLLDLAARRASISIRDLPQLPAGQMYYLWADVDGAKVAIGQFRTLADGTLLTQFTIPLQPGTVSIQQLLLSVENRPDATAPAGPVVMASPSAARQKPAA